MVANISVCFSSGSKKNSGSVPTSGSVPVFGAVPVRHPARMWAEPSILGSIGGKINNGQVERRINLQLTEPIQLLRTSLQGNLTVPSSRCDCVSSKIHIKVLGSGTASFIRQMM